MNEFELLHAHLGRLAEQMRRLTSAAFGNVAQWHPALNAFRLKDRFLVCLELAGMEKRAISVRAEPHRLIISGQRVPPEPPHESGSPPQVLAMEIDSGPFERVIELPEEIVPERVTATYNQGLLWIEMPLKFAQPITIEISQDTK
ncbi:MAG: Hsp20/alpha crystallin family protein [Verrucomicrobiales bacterium]|nr:Hsp20/alpha crystallin family protein [Verrucomicrobiales bacterium]